MERTEILKSPFHMIIVGMTACGKTHYLLRLLEKDYMKHFENIYLICPTYEWNKTYQEWKYNKDKNFIVIPCDHEDVDDYIKEITDIAKGTNSLIILDDCASSQCVKNRTSELVKLGFSGRHYGLSTIVITQQLTSIAKPYREQISKIVVFLPSSDKDLKFIFEEYLSDLDKQELNSIRKTLKTVRYARLELQRRIPQCHIVVVPHK